MIGRRVVVWGVTGSGKTGFARSLGEALGLGVVEMDAIRHARGWDSTPWDEFRERLTQTLDGYGEGWVCDGSYSRISDVYLSRADTLIWLHVPWRVSFWRLLRRTIRRSWTKEPLYEGSPARESWRQSFFSPKSILWWGLAHHCGSVRRRYARTAALRATLRVYELRTAREVEAFLRATAQIRASE